MPLQTLRLADLDDRIITTLAPDAFRDHDVSPVAATYEDKTLSAPLSRSPLLSGPHTTLRGRSAVASIVCYLSRNSADAAKR